MTWSFRRTAVAHAPLILAVLTLPGSARIAAAAAPVFLGSFTSAGLCSPRGIAVSTSGEVFVGSDCQAPHMEHFTDAGALLETWTFPRGYLGTANGVALDEMDNLYATDSEENRVMKLTTSGTGIGTWGSFGTGPGQFYLPVDLAADGSGHLYVVEGNGRRVQKFRTAGTYLTMIGSIGSGPGQYQDPAGIAVDASDRLYVADYSRGRILRYRADGTFDMEFAVQFSLTNTPSDVAVGPDGNIYVIGFEAGEVNQYSPSGVLLSTFGPSTRLNGAYRIAISHTGMIYITEQENNQVSRFRIDLPTGATRATFGQLKVRYR